jgi:hypothetical protein
MMLEMHCRTQIGIMLVMRASGVVTAVRASLVAIIVLVSACQAAGPELSPDPGELRGDWLVVEVNGILSRELGVIVTFGDGIVDTANVCNGFTVSYGFGDTFIQRLPRDTTVTYGGAGCVIGDDVDGGVLDLLYFNSGPTSAMIEGDKLQLISGEKTVVLVR